MNKKRLGVVFFVGLLFLMFGGILSLLYPAQERGPSSVVPSPAANAHRVFREQGPITTESPFAVVLPKNPGLPTALPQYLLSPPLSSSFEQVGALFGYTATPSGAIFKGTTTAYWTTQTSGLSFTSVKNIWAVSYQTTKSPSINIGLSPESISGFASRVVQATTGKAALFSAQKSPTQSEGLVALDISPSSLQSFSLMQQSPRGLFVFIDYNQSGGQAIIDSSGFLRYFSLSAPVSLVDTNTLIPLLPYEQIKGALESGAGVIVGSNQPIEGKAALSFTRFVVSSVSLVYAVDTTANTVSPAYLCVGTASGKGENQEIRILLRADIDKTTPGP